MKKGLLSFSAFLFALVAAPQAQAWVGGPFDSGDYNVLMEREGVYQATMTYKNGSGFCQFAQDNALGAQINGNNASLSVFSLENRSLLYYKGITYAGTATGVVDFGAKRVHGFTNGTTTLSTSANTGGNNGSTASNDPIVINGTDPYPGFGFSNSQFTAKITSTAPLLRFSGKGQASFFIDPQVEELRDTINQVVQDIDFDAGLPIFIDTDGDGTPDDTAVLPPTADEIAEKLSTVIRSAIDLLAEVDAASSPANNIEFVKMKVVGSRRYF